MRAPTRSCCRAALARASCDAPPPRGAAFNVGLWGIRSARRAALEGVQRCRLLASRSGHHQQGSGFIGMIRQLRVV